MYRLDRIVNEARLLRVRRASRRQALWEGQNRRTSSPTDTREWFAEEVVAMRVLADLAKGGDVGEVGDGSPDARRSVRCDVIDLRATTPFVKACELALRKVVGEMSPADALMEAWYPAVCAAVSPGVDPALRGPDEVTRARRGAVEDVCALAVEHAMFEAVNRICKDFDRKRPVSERADPDGIVVEGDRVARPSKRKEDAERRRRLRADAAAARLAAARAKQADLRGARRAAGVVGLQANGLQANDLGADELEGMVGGDV